jgi:hypothetical protein
MSVEIAFCSEGSYFAGWEWAAVGSEMLVCVLSENIVSVMRKRGRFGGVLECGTILERFCFWAAWVLAFLVRF